MKNIFTLISNIIHKVEFICISLLCISLLYSALIYLNRSHDSLLYVFYFGFCGVFVIITYTLRKILGNSNVWIRVLYIMLIALLIRVMAVYFINLTQQGDYKVYLTIANKIYMGDFNKTKYYGIFPHALNYPIFLSGLYKLVGNSNKLPYIINIVLGVIGTGCIVGIAEKSINYKFGLIAGLAVALNPSIILFTLLSGGEPVYDSLMIVSLFFFVKTFGKNKKISIIYGIITGITCAFGNFFRPTGVIFIIAAVIVFAIHEQSDLITKITRLGALIISYTLIVFLLGQLTYQINGYEKPSKSYGWNLFIGANEKSEGHWNSADGDLFNKKIFEYENPSELQSYFAELGFERYLNMKSNAPKHFINKLSIWFNEGFIATTVTQWQNEYTRFKSANSYQTFNNICFIYNILFIISSMIIMVYTQVMKKPSFLMKHVSLYLTGSIIIFMLLETAGRYKGAYYSMITLLGSYGVYMLYCKVKKYLYEHSCNEQ